MSKTEAPIVVEEYEKPDKSGNISRFWELVTIAETIKPKIWKNA